MTHICLVDTPFGLEYLGIFPLFQFLAKFSRILDVKIHIFGPSLTDFERMIHLKSIANCNTWLCYCFSK
eukprot:12356.XXX_21314_21520_1 [CDS] Oithona nana genome sequencing.